MSLLIALLPALASAATPHSPSSTSIAGLSDTSPKQRRHALYVEALGKGGLWGLGYDYLLSERLAIGGIGSLYFLDAQRIAILSPYLSYYPIGTDKSRMMIQAGPQFAHQSTVSSIPEWPGMSTEKISAQVGAGWELRSNYLFRVYGMVAASNAGIAPWLGLSAGWTF